MTPRIYVASLSDYNAGRLHGRWIDADQDADAIWSEVQEMLAESSEPVAEEWAIHDYDGFEGVAISEYESFEDVAGIARAIDEHGAAFAAWLDNDSSRTYEDMEDFEEAYCGEWDSFRDYAEQFVDDLGYLDQAPEFLQSYFDYEKFARDLEMDHWTFVDSNYRTHVFRSY